MNNQPSYTEVPKKWSHIICFQKEKGIDMIEIPVK